jgi:hypothetical protein
VLSVKEKEYVESARALGVGDWYIITRHILPSCVAPIIVIATPPDDFSRIGDNDYYFSIQFHRGWITGCFGSKSERKDDRTVER